VGFVGFIGFLGWLAILHRPGQATARIVRTMIRRVASNHSNMRLARLTARPLRALLILAFSAAAAGTPIAIEVEQAAGKFTLHMKTRQLVANLIIQGA
jgi:hypothetical protein